MTSPHNGNGMVAATRELPASGYALEVDGPTQSRICNQSRRQGRWRRTEEALALLQIRIYDTQTNARKRKSQVFQLKPWWSSSASARAATAARALVQPAEVASRPSSFDHSRKTSSPARRGHSGKGPAGMRVLPGVAITAPFPGCPPNRSRRCTRSRVPPSASLCSRSCGRHLPLRRCALGARPAEAFGPGT